MIQSKSKLISCCYAIHFNIFNFMKIEDILTFKECLCSCEFECINECIDKNLKEKFWKTPIKKLIGILIYYRARITHETCKDMIIYTGCAQFAVLTIVDEIYKKRLRIFLEPYSKHIDIYNLIVNGALLDKYYSSVFESNMKQNCFNLSMTVQKKDFDKIELLIVESGHSIKKLSHYRESKNIISFSFDDSKQCANCNLIEIDNYKKYPTKFTVFGLSPL